MAENPTAVFRDQGVESKVEDKEHSNEEDYFDGAALASALHEFAPGVSSFSAKLFGFLAALDVRGQCIKASMAIAAAVALHTDLAIHLGDGGRFLRQANVIAITRLASDGQLTYRLLKST